MNTAEIRQRKTLSADTFVQDIFRRGILKRNGCAHAAEIRSGFGSAAADRPDTALVCGAPERHGRILKDLRLR